MIWWLCIFNIGNMHVKIVAIGPFSEHRRGGFSVFSEINSELVGLSFVSKKIH